MDDYIKRNILCIDLKSFFASVECVERKLDPYNTPLVVCDPTRNGAITLAVSPYLKKFGIKGRSRVYELPKNLGIIKVPPRMRLYQQKSKEVIKIYLEYVAPEDLHIYSIDECFLDVTNYLKLYKKTDYELALEILNKIEAKHTKDNIAYWGYDEVKTKLWSIHPLSKMWGIGPHMEVRLNKLGFSSIGDIAQANKELLRKNFGIIGEELWLHANGIDTSKISDLNNAPVKEKSYSHSQVLFKDYFDFNINLIIFEMLDVLCRRLRKEKKLCGLIGFGISYSKSVGGGFYHSNKLAIQTDDSNILYRECMHIFDKYYNKSPIRKVSISFGKLTNNETRQLDLFQDPKKVEKIIQINEAIDSIKEKYGANKLVPAASLLKDSTLLERNNKIGGHNA